MCRWYSENFLERNIATRNCRKLEVVSSDYNNLRVTMDNFIAGSIAGIVVDVSLFPLDTIKTRLQASQGFAKAGGFRGVYQGLGPVAIGSGPGAAFFFVSYEYSKEKLLEKKKKDGSPLLNKSVVHMCAASVGEFIACLVRVPTEVVKQRMQTAASVQQGRSIVAMLEGIKRSPGGFRTLYSGFSATLLREIPFSMIQFPLYEATKTYFNTEKGDSSIGAAICGCGAGSLAAFLTTPMDVVKTRLMLGGDAKGVPYDGVISTGRRIYGENGVRSLFSGATPRTFWIGVGGFVFFGAYTRAKNFLADSV